MRFSIASLYYVAPSFLRGGLALGVLPFSTQILGPSDYGIYSVAVTIAQLCVAVAMSGTEYLLYGSFGGADAEKKASLVSTTFWVAIGVALLMSVALAVGGGLLVRGLGIAVLPAWAMHWLIPWLVVGAIPWSVGVLLTIASANAKTYAACAILESIVSTVALLLALFLFQLGTISLFVGAVAGTAVTAIFGIRVAAPYMRLRVDREWLRQLWRVAPAAVLKNGAERSYEAVERSVLAAAAGLHQAGLYTHSQQYKNLAAMVVKAVAYAVWPVSLREAQAVVPSFEQTRRIWAGIFVAVGCVGIVFAFIAEPLIAMLTHGKFTAAYPLAVLWLVLILLQNTGKPAVATVHVQTSLGRAYKHIGTASSLLAVALVFILVPLFGIFGAATAALVQVIAFRVAVVRLARTAGPLPSQDAMAFLGAAFIVGALAAQHLFRASPALEVVSAVTLELSYLWLARQTLQDVFALVAEKLKVGESSMSTKRR